MAGKNRLNLVIEQNLGVFADDLHLSPEQASQWHKFVGLVDSLKPTKVLLLPDGQLDYFNDEWLDLVSLA